METNEQRQKLNDVKKLYDSLRGSDNVLLTGRYSVQRDICNEYSAKYREWYNGMYELITTLLDENDIDVTLFRSVMKDNNEHASILRDNLHKIEAAYKALVIKIERKLTNNK